jgi:hypothetical protein
MIKQKIDILAEVINYMPEIIMSGDVCSASAFALTFVFRLLVRIVFRK